MREWGIPWTEIADMAAHLPPDSACRLVDQHPHRLLAELLREVEHDLRRLAWSGRGEPPTKIALPWDEPEIGQGDAVEWDDATTVWTDPRFAAALEHLEQQI